MKKLLMGFLLSSMASTSFALTIEKVTVEDSGNPKVYEEGTLCVLQDAGTLAQMAYQKWEAKKVSIEQLEMLQDKLAKNNQIRNLVYKVSPSKDCLSEGNTETIFEVENIGRQPEEKSLVTFQGYVMNSERVSFNVKYKQDKKGSFTYKMIVSNPNSLASKRVIIEGSGNTGFNTPEQEISEFIDQNLDVGESRLGYGRLTMFGIH